jgi:hypothetical protein
MMKYKQIIKAMLFGNKKTREAHYKILEKLSSRTNSIILVIIGTISSASFYLWLTKKPLRIMDLYIAFLSGLCIALSIIPILRFSKWATKKMNIYLNE